MDQIYPSSAKNVYTTPPQGYYYTNDYYSQVPPPPYKQNQTQSPLPPIGNSISRNQQQASGSTSKTTSFFRSKLFYGLLIAIGVLIALGLIVAIVLIVLYATIPCSMIKCNSMASRCINHPFKPQCICDYGYNGDGISYCDACGVVYYNQDLRIVGGIQSTAYSWPSIVYVQFHYQGTVYISGVGYMNIDKTYACGGNLIDRATGHCVPDSIDVDYQSSTYTVNITPTASMFEVVVGGYNRSNFGNYPSVIVGVSAIERNPNFDDSTDLNDISVLKLNQAVTLNQYVQIACLPDPTQSGYPIAQNQDAYIVGWGVTSYSSTTEPNTLMNTKITIYNSSSCANVFPTVQKDWDSQVCAGNLAGGKDTCQGDSGGPLYTSGTVLGATKFILAGLTSYGDECALPGMPG